jgi:sugar lactone lactonase YvrE
VFLGNGPCWSPDNRTFYHADSLRHLIYAYDYDLATGRAATGARSSTAPRGDRSPMERRSMPTATCGPRSAKAVWCCA